MSKKEVRDMYVASLLHDVGKIGIDDRILRKPGALTPEEFEEMKKHPEKGANIMAPIRQMRDMIPGIHFHHERFGGGGYPKGLKGEQIPRQARVVQVADSFDAMTTNRPYQKCMTYETAVGRIHELIGVVFDPKIVETFIEAYKAGELGLSAQPPDLEAAGASAAVSPAAPGSTSESIELPPAPDSDDKSPQPAGAGARHPRRS
jgi:response regulator RpfG family c-di-GMP phosphodiesterase